MVKTSGHQDYHKKKSTLNECHVRDILDERTLQAELIIAIFPAKVISIFEYFKYTKCQINANFSGNN